ncbi:glycosyltransferase family 2 protein [Nitrospira sp. BLG_1]|uniref:glycosyltransferase family 2 protein n=1 Tax=Nitrospira sp. BLG_1 TaxID=3395883 RepID=UPI0039BC897F
MGTFRNYESLESTGGGCVEKSSNSMSQPLKLTIITPSFNQGAYIEQTIGSVLAQDYPRVEHIVIDGGSTDCTVDVLNKYPHLLWVSERDRGQADALNKGLAKASGDIIGWINSDDYYETNIFKSVVEYFQDPDVMWVVGNLTYRFEDSNESIPGRSPVISFDRLLNNPDIVRQQSAFFRKAFIERVGGWNSEYFMVMDFDLWVRMAKISAPMMVDENWAYFRLHSLQKTSYTNTLRQARELGAILKCEKVHWVIIANLWLRKRWASMKGCLKECLVNSRIINPRYRSRPMRITREK